VLPGEQAPGGVVPFSPATTAKVYIRNLRFYDHFALFSLVGNATECPVDGLRLMKEFLG